MWAALIDSLTLIQRTFYHFKMYAGEQYFVCVMSGALKTIVQGRRSEKTKTKTKTTTKRKQKPKLKQN
jgi:hypothetical protein